MECCQCQGIERSFNKKIAARELKQYRKKGPTKTTRMLLEALEAEGLDGNTLLDIGGGIGAIQHELLSNGVSTATTVEASTAYIEVSQAETERLGHDDRVNHLYGNFVDLAADIEPVDIVTLDKVICCYDDMEALVSLSSLRARKWYGLVYPRNNWLNKLIFPLINLYSWAQRNPYRAYLHPTDAVDEIVRRNGMAPRFQSNTAIWQVVVYAG
jgi:magnesium-protoporphyrin O-methyltransferase